MELIGQLSGSTDFLTGGAGWAGAGLLGLVLGWLLLKHLPDRDRQQMELLTIYRQEVAIERKAADVRDDKFLTALKDVNNKLSESLEAVARAMLDIQNMVESNHKEEMALINQHACANRHASAK